MRFALVALVLAPLVASADAETEAGKLTAAIRARNAKAVARRLGSSLYNAGVWFPDAACAKKFAKPGTVVAKEVGEFARCLSKLELQMSTRTTARRDSAVLTYKPGIEVEVTFVGSTLRRIGMPLHDPKLPIVPTLTVQAFEELRISGTTLVDDKLPPGQTASVWIKTCVDAIGAVTSMTPHGEHTPEVGKAVLAAVADWKFKPFRHRHVAHPSCSLSLLTVPATTAPATEVLPDGVAPPPDLAPSPPRDGAPYQVPPTLLESLRLTGSKQIVPAEAERARMIADGKDKVVASIKMCLDTSGLVAGLTLLKTSGYAAYDRVILAEMKRWTYRPYLVQRKAVDVCTAVVIIYAPSP